MMHADTLELRLNALGLTTASEMYIVFNHTHTHNWSDIMRLNMKSLFWETYSYDESSITHNNDKRHYASALSHTTKHTYFNRELQSIIG